MVKNKIQFNKKQAGKIKNKSQLEDQLGGLYKQHPNKKFLGIPRQYFYYTSMDTIGKSKIGKGFSNFQRKKLGEEPAIYREELTNQTAESMRFFLQNKGYLQANVEHFTNYRKKSKKAEVTYKISPNGLYTFDTIFFESKDKKVEDILLETRSRSFLKKGKPVSAEAYDREVQRISNFLRNNGYAYFYPQYIKNLVALDSTNYKIKAKLEVLVAPGDTVNPVYTVGDIFIYPFFNPSFPSTQIPDTLIEGHYFATGGRPFNIKAKTLLTAISLKKGELFSQEKVKITDRQLRSLGVFRIVSIKFEEDPIQSGVLNFNIFLTTNKKWEFGTDFDVNTTERKGVVGNRNLIGFSVSPSIRSRNLFKGAELFVSNIDLGIELAPLADTILNTLDFKVTAELFYPRFVDYFKLWKGLNKVGLVSNRYYNNLTAHATSHFSVSYNLLTLINFYKFNIADFSFGYDVKTSSRSRYIVNNFGFDFLFPQTRPAFDTILAQNPFLDSSFTKQLFTGFLLRDFTYIYTPPSKRAGQSWYFESNFEISGLELWAANSISNAISGKSKTFDFFDVDFSQFAKLELDLRHYWKLGPKRTFITRLSSGIAIPFGFTNSVPYVKQFFVGGPQSIRGWTARGLGPGSFVDDFLRDKGNRNLFFQAADFKLEFNIEYRFHMFRPFGLFNLNGAFFVDGGNIWSLGFIQDDRPGATISWKRKTDEFGKIINDNFFREFAVSAGFGARLDFTYVIVRLDLGTPVKNNFPDPNRNNSYWVDYSKWRLRDIVFNLGLGYPF